jgi:hypothetical protein
MALALTVLSTCAYLPMLRLPLIADDYLQIGMARDYAGDLGWETLFADALYRCRATSLLLTWVIDRLGGPEPVWVNSVCLLIHVLNSLLVWALGSWNRIGWTVSAPAAAFFAVHEGHQEAVVWFSALPELLVFTFVLASVLAWIQWTETGETTRAALAGLALVAALFSKESAVIIPPVMAAVALAGGIPWRRWLPWVGLFSAACAVYAAVIFQAKATHLHFNDGTFSLTAPFWHTLPVSVGRMLWIWGVAALAAGCAWGGKAFWRICAVAAVWTPVALLPYSFLTYMPRVPSRHTYLASVGLALLAGAAWQTTRERFGASRRWVPAVAAAVVLVHNCGYLWIKKTPQYEERARATEKLIEFAAHRSGPIYVECFPYGADVVYHSLRVRGHRRRSEIHMAPAAVPEGAQRICIR